jgi:hemerythrin
VDLINEITKAISDNRPEECERLMPKFVSFAKANFAREESMLAKNDYSKVGKLQNTTLV